MRRARSSGGSLVRQARPSEAAGLTASRRRASLGPALALLVLAGIALGAALAVTGLARSSNQAPRSTDAAGIAAGSPGTPAGGAGTPAGGTAMGARSSGGLGQTSASATPGPAGPTADPQPSPRATPTPRPTRPPGSAPGSARGFDLRSTVVPMGFPFISTADYEYANNFLDRRAGVARKYNHVRGVLKDGSLERAHDGIDLYVERGTPVRSVFEGIVINPARRWRPWDPARYGRTVVVISTEPTSRGYTALMVHLSRVDVRHGDRVRRGQVVGRTGDTGNAEGVPIHLHFELRAPFELRLREAGRIRHVDAFDPYPSLRAADPQRPHARR